MPQLSQVLSSRQRVTIFFQRLYPPPAFVTITWYLPFDSNCSSGIEESGLGKVLDFFTTELGRNSWDGQGGQLPVAVHLGKGMDNAFFAGGSKPFVGINDDGVYAFSFARCLDVLAHEVTHGGSHAARANDARVRPDPRRPRFFVSPTVLECRCYALLPPRWFLLVRMSTH